MISVSNASYAVIITDSNDEVISFNPVAEALFGWRSDEILGLQLSKTIFHHSGSRLYEFTSAAKTEPSSSKSLLSENKARHRDGHEIPVQLIISKLETPKDTSYLINAVDIREQLRRENTIRNSLILQKIINSILQLTLKNISLESFFIRTLELIVSYKSLKLLPKGAVYLTDLETGQLNLQAHIGFTPEQIEACTTVSPGICHCGRALSTGEVQFASFVDDRHDIRYLGMEPHGHFCIPILSSGRVLGVIDFYVREGQQPRSEEQETMLAIANILAGVVERKKMETQRASLVDRLHSAMTAAWNEKLFTNSIIESLNNGLLVLDPDGIISVINPFGREILKNFTAEKSLVGLNLSQVFQKNISDRLLDNSLPSSSMTKEISLPTLSGEDKVIGYHTVPWKDSQSRELGHIISLTDLTEVKRTQREMEKMNHLITVAEIASAVAHEVRNPLAGIKTMSQSIEENMEPEDDNKEYLVRIIRQVDRLNELLTNFFTFAKPVTPKRRKVSLIDIIGETKQLVSKKLTNRNIKFYEAYEVKLPFIFADPNQTQQVFLNLMLNSIEAIEEDGIIDIKAHILESDDPVVQLFPEFGLHLPPENYVKVIFTDNGCGMEKETREKAFKPFFSTKSQGTGLGLSIVYRILQENNAVIMLDPDVVDGASFIILFEK
ncbi:MAG: PAS domain S-box protein [Desulfobulbaceae bacterium]|nr:PAS domain S-box protein [Desulfobulbaceae bacterium]